MKKFLLGCLISGLFFSTNVNAQTLDSTSNSQETIESSIGEEVLSSQIEVEENITAETEEPTSFVQVESSNQLIQRLVNSDEQQAFINQIAPLAQIEAKDKGLYASVMIAQAILESDWGKSPLAISPNNNLFGIKGDYQGAFVLHETSEWDPEKGEFVKKTEKFKKYPDTSYSLRDNADKLRNGVSWDPNYYQGTWMENTQSYKDATRALTGTYATDPTYNTKLDKIIETYHLVQYDSNYLEPEKEDIKDISRDVSIKPGSTNNIHSRPYPYQGYEILGNVIPYQGRQVHLSQEAKTSVAVYYLADGIGWISSGAFTNSLDTVNKSSFERHAKIKANAFYYFYSEPYNTKNSFRTGESTEKFYNQDVEITQTATNNRTQEKFYLVKDYGWITENAFTTIYDEENIKNISKDGSIKPDANNNIHSRPYPYYGFEITGHTREHQGTQVHISQEAKTSAATYYLADGIGWIASGAFTTSLDTVSKSNFSRMAKIYPDKLYYFYKEPYNTKGSYRVGPTTQAFYGKDVEIVEKATNNRTKETFYLVKDQGWLTENAFQIIYDEEQITSISKDLTITSSANNNIHTRPYPYYGFEITGTTKPYQGKQVHISEQAITSNGTYYSVDNIGWIRSSAFTNSLDSVTKATFNRDAKILNKTFFFYKEPYNTKSSERTGQTTDSLKNKDVILTQKAISKNNGNIYYNIKDYGWVDQKALLIYDVPNYEKINITESILPNVSYNVHTKPYPYQGFEIIGNTKSMNMNNKTFTIKQQAHTSNGIYYDVPGYGWVNKNAFSSDIQKYNEVQKLLDRKYRSGNYGIYVKSLKSGASAGVFQDTRYTAASTGKLPAIYYTQKRYNNKSLNPNTQFLYTDAINQMNESYGRGGAGILQNKPFGGMYSIDTILNWTIYYSDNQGANFLGYYAANKYSREMKQEISQIIGRQWDSPFSITAKENGKLMEAIYKQGGNANKYLQNTSFDNQRIPKYLPVNVGHKIGDVFDYRHDVAIVYAKEPYILSVMTKNYQSYESISQLSLEIYNILK